MNLRGFFFFNFFSSETGGGGEVTVGQYTVESTRDRPGIRYTNVRDPLKHLRCQFKQRKIRQDKSPELTEKRSVIDPFKDRESVKKREAKNI